MRKLYAVALAGLSVMVGTAHAALPVSVGTSFTALQDDIQAVFDIAFPVMLVVVGLSLVWKYVSKYGRKV